MVGMLCFLSILIAYTCSVYALLEPCELNETYTAGDTIRLCANLINTYNGTKYFDIEQVIVYPEESGLPVLILPPTTISLTPNEKAIIKGIDLNVYKTMKTGEYRYIVKVLDAGKELERLIVPFYIVGTLQTFDDLEIHICKDAKCDQQKTVFVVDEDAYVKVIGYENGSIEGYANDVILDFNGGVAKLPTYEKGEYEVMVSVSKIGYENKTLTMRYKVIENLPMIEKKHGIKDGICDRINDGVCDPDCLPEFDPDCAKEEQEKVRGLLYYTMIIILACSMLLIFLKLKKRKTQIYGKEFNFKY
ncbi:MAG: hypothetical protein DRP03_02470 [Candidatus Aenigmatarchaeota archaeon]|nr:MAG: hypothetical protein DRP03_02470 [Candidatus Aenigmarchaeota archaeon]